MLLQPTSLHSDFWASDRGSGYQTYGLNFANGNEETLTMTPSCNVALLKRLYKAKTLHGKGMEFVSGLKRIHGLCILGRVPRQGPRDNVSSSTSLQRDSHGSCRALAH